MSENKKPRVMTVILESAPNELMYRSVCLSDAELQYRKKFISEHQPKAWQAEYIKVVEHQAYQKAIDAIKKLNHSMTPNKIHHPSMYEAKEHAIKLLKDLGELTTPEREG